MSRADVASDETTPYFASYCPQLQIRDSGLYLHLFCVAVTFSLLVRLLAAREARSRYYTVQC
jgi:hypothetical protein